MTVRLVRRAAFLLAMAGAAHAQDHAHHHAPPAPSAAPATQTHPEHSAHAGPAQTPHDPVPPPTDADRAAAFPALAAHMEHAPGTNWRVLFDRLESRDGAHGNEQAWEGQAWIGGDIDRLWIRSEGERAAGATEAANLELLYGHAVSPWWDVVAGIRRDFASGDSRSWAAVGIQGLAPYRFEVSATAYVGESGQAAASVEIEYEMLLTNRLVLQPALEATLHRRDEPQRGIGSGLSEAEAGLRLRYEITRRFAPYVGYAWSRAFGRTADLRQADGEPASSDGWVAGVRIWF